MYVEIVSSRVAEFRYADNSTHHTIKFNNDIDESVHQLLMIIWSTMVNHKEKMTLHNIVFFLCVVDSVFYLKHINIIQ